MTKDIFKDRERAFEAVYFARVNAELVEKIHADREALIAKGLIARASGIEDEALLQRILGLGVNAQNLQAGRVGGSIATSARRPSTRPKRKAFATIR